MASLTDSQRRTSFIPDGVNADVGAQAGGKRQRFSVLIGMNSIVLAVLGLSQMAFEYVLGAVAPTPDFENYVICRNVFLIFMPLASFGLNEVIVRRGSLQMRDAYRPYLVLTVLALAWAVAFVLRPPSVVRRQGMPDPKLLALCAMLFCIVQAVASLIRSRQHFTIALLARDGWRALLWLSLLIIPLAGGYASGVTLLLAVVGILIGGPATIYVLTQFHRAERVNGDPSLWSDISLGAFFWITMLSLVAVTYLDQLILGTIATDHGALKTYALAVTFVVTPFALIATSAGSILVPVIANGARMRTWLETRLRDRKALVFWIMLCGVASVLYFLLLDRVFIHLRVTLTPGLYALLLITGCVRLLYTIPSSVLGAIGPRKLVAVFASSGIVAIALQVLLVVGLYRALGVLGVATATLIVWLFRLAIGLVTIRRLQY